MDSRINFISHLKDCITSRNSMVRHIQLDPPEEVPTPEQLEYENTRQQIIESCFFLKADKHLKIRLTKWIQYLDKIQSNQLWIKSRNKYAKLLSLMCHCQCLFEPFHGLPPEGDLPTLRKHQVNNIIDQVQNYVKNASKSTKISRVDSRERIGHTSESVFVSRARSGESKYQSVRDQEMPLKPRDTNSRKTQEAATQKKTIKLKQLNESHSSYKNNTCMTSESVSKIRTNEVYKADRKPISTAHNRQPLKKVAELSVYETGKSRERHQKQNIRKTPQPKKAKTEKSQLLCGYPPKAQSKLQIKRPQLTQIEVNPKEYWQQKTNSQIHTPKYLNNYSSQQLIQEEEHCVQIVSFRDREGDVCDCTNQMLGGNWFSKLFPKTSQ